MTRTPPLANPPLPMVPPNTRFTAPLHGILPVSQTRYVYYCVYEYVNDYVYDYVYDCIYVYNYVYDYVYDCVYNYIYSYAYNYIYSYVYRPVTLRRRHDHYEHCIATPIACPSSHQVSDASAIIGNCSSVLAAVSDWI